MDGTMDGTPLSDEMSALVLTVETFLAIAVAVVALARPEVAAVYELYRCAVVSARSPIAPALVFACAAGGIFGAAVLIYDVWKRLIAAARADSAVRPHEN